MMALEYFKIFQQNETWRPRLPWCCFFQVFASSPARQLELNALAIVIVNARTPPLVAAPRELPGKRCMSAHFETVSFNAMWVDFGDVDKLFFPALSLLWQLRLPHIPPRERPASKLSPVWAKTTPLSGGKGVTVKNVNRINIQLPSQHNKN